MGRHYNKSHELVCHSHVSMFSREPPTDSISSSLFIFPMKVPSPVLICVTVAVTGDTFMDNLPVPAETESYLQPGVIHTLDSGG